MTTRKPDMRYAGQVLAAEVKRRFGGVYDAAEQTGISASSIYRIQRGDKPADHAEVLRLEGALGLPRGAVALLSRKDFDGLSAIGTEADFVRYARELAGEAPSRSARKRVVPLAV